MDASTPQQDAYGALDAVIGDEIQTLMQRRDDLLTEVYTVLYEGAPLDRGEIDSLMESVVAAADEIADTAQRIALVLEPREQQALLEHDGRRIYIPDAPIFPGLRGPARLSIDAADGGWRVGLEVANADSLGAHYRLVGGHHRSPLLRRAIRLAVPWHKESYAYADGVAEQVVGKLLGEKPPTE